MSLLTRLFGVALPQNILKKYGVSEKTGLSYAPTATEPYSGLIYITSLVKQLGRICTLQK